MEEKTIFPKITEKTWWGLREKFLKSIPSELTTAYLQSALGYKTDSSAKNNAITPLKQIGFIDDNNKTTQRSKDWRLDEKYTQVCNDILKDVYPQNMLELFPDANADREEVKRYFLAQGLGESAVNNSTIFFMLLRNPQIKTIEELKKSNPKSAIIKSNKTPKKDKIGIEQKNTVVAQKTIDISSPNLHIDIQIHIASDTSPDQIDKIFESMAKHLYKNID
ncbi:MAG TPA: DUF5343 domain-containing protein [Clostridia bacterium]|nr:DUF5343 domain-containing protein [Clostridia bacterium]